MMMNAIVTGAIAPKSFDRIPTITLPQDYFTTMPSYLARMAREHGPIFRRMVPPHMQPVLGEWIVYLVGPEANRFVLQSHRQAFSHDRGWSPILMGVFEQGLLNTDDPAHARQRKMMNPAFAVSYMNAYLPIMEVVIADRTRDWADRGEVDLYAEARKITFDVAAAALTGLRTGAEVDRLRELFYELVRPDGGGAYASMQDYFMHIADVRAELDAILLDKIAQRRQDPTDDLLGMLVAARDDEGRAFGDRDILGHLHILLVAGHETSTTLAAWLLYLLATHPDYLARVHAELDAIVGAAAGTDDRALGLREIRGLRALGRAVDEAGRLYSPVGNVPRGTVEEVAFGGYTVPAETRVLLSLSACHRLPEVFADPDAFDPGRFAPPREEDKRTPYGLVTFGGGPRICIGINFAGIEIRALAARVLRAYTLEPRPGHTPVQAYNGVTAMVEGGIPVRVKRRASS